MAVTYRITKHRDTMRQETECKYIMQAITGQEVDLRRLSWEISNMSTHTEADVYGVLMMLVKQMKFHLADGNTVVLDDMGRFKIGFQCAPEETPEKLTSKSIKKFSINYLPSVTMRRWLKGGLQIIKEKKGAVKNKKLERPI